LARYRVGRRENVCVCGPSGTGKSHFCEALGQAAVEAGMTVAWFRMNWPLTRGAWVVSAQHGDLVAEHQDLEVLGFIGSSERRQPAEHG
jgi:ABC-type nitrate/sulfonate/bicarbonate transport system ATPase subunit